MGRQGSTKNHAALTNETYYSEQIKPGSIEEVPKYGRREANLVLIVYHQQRTQEFTSRKTEIEDKLHDKSGLYPEI